MVYFRKVFRNTSCSKLRNHLEFFRNNREQCSMYYFSDIMLEKHINPNICRKNRFQFLYVKKEHTVTCLIPFLTSQAASKKMKREDGIFFWVVKALLFPTFPVHCTFPSFLVSPAYILITTVVLFWVPFITTAYSLFCIQTSLTSLPHWNLHCLKYTKVIQFLKLPQL